MGWKNVKDHYRIEHNVQVTDKGICIGSGYIHNIIVLGLDGKVLRRHEGGMNEDLTRYQREIDADPALLKRLIDTPDTFSVSITIYTYDGGKVIENLCETPEWPNVTHDGQMIYENTFSTDKATVVAWAKRNADLGIKAQRQNVEEIEAKLADYQDRLAEEIANRERLEADYPDVVIETED